MLPTDSYLDQNITNCYFTLSSTSIQLLYLLGRIKISRFICTILTQKESLKELL